jgi:hypothetical protein
MHMGNVKASECTHIPARTVVVAAVVVVVVGICHGTYMRLNPSTLRLQHLQDRSAQETRD